MPPLVRSASPDPPRLTLVRVSERRGVHPFMRETNVSGIYPPLGLAYLAAAARRAGYPAQIVDAHADGVRRPEEMARRVAATRPDVVGVTSTSFNWPVVAELCRGLRRLLPGARLWVGGPQLALYPEACLEVRAIDAAVVGEGDETVVEMLARVAAGEPLEGLPGTIVRRGDELVRGPDRAPIAELDRLPLPALELLPLARYRALTLPTPFVTMVTTRGCPYRCRYCAQIYVGGRYREHGVERVLEELRRAVQRYGAREIVFFDETFTLNRRRVLALCQAVLAAGLRVRFNIRTRADLCDDEVLRALRDAGCASIHVGIEAGSERVRRLMNKQIDMAKGERALAEARRLGMETRGYFMLGYPGETRAEIEETIRAAVELPLDWASFTITTPAPGTEVYREALASGRIARDYWLDYTRLRAGRSPGYFTSEAEGLDARALEALLGRAYRAFYLRPALLARKLTDGRLWRQLPSILGTLAAIR